MRRTQEAGKAYCLSLVYFGMWQFSDSSRNLKSAFGNLWRGGRNSYFTIINPPTISPPHIHAKAVPNLTLSAFRFWTCHLWTRFVRSQLLLIVFLMLKSRNLDNDLHCENSSGFFFHLRSKNSEKVSVLYRTICIRMVTEKSYGNHTCWKFQNVTMTTCVVVYSARIFYTITLAACKFQPFDSI